MAGLFGYAHNLVTRHPRLACRRRPPSSNAPHFCGWQPQPQIYRLRVVVPVYSMARALPSSTPPTSGATGVLWAIDMITAIPHGPHRDGRRPGNSGTAVGAIIAAITFLAPYVGATLPRAYGLPSR